MTDSGSVKIGGVCNTPEMLKFEKCAIKSVKHSLTFCNQNLVAKKAVFVMMNGSSQYEVLTYINVCKYIINIKISFMSILFCNFVEY